MMKMDLMMTTLEPHKWWDDAWFKKWEEISHQSYQGNKIYGWGCYYDENNKLTYDYIKMYCDRHK